MRSSRWSPRSRNGYVHHSPFSSVQVVVIGAGPYGLSIAAYLHARRVEFRIFGRAMESQRTEMPAGMLLKSEGFASNLYDPEGRSTLEAFCVQDGLTYANTGVAIPLDTFTAYGLWFQRQHVRDLEQKMVECIEQSPWGFRLRIDDGEIVDTRRVVVAVGGGYFRHVPSNLQHLPAEFLSHSADHHDLHGFRGRDVTVIGGGASAFDLAALLHEAGVQVRLIARRPSLVFHSKPGQRTTWLKLRYPVSGIGPGWRSMFFAEAPMVFRHLPQKTRVRTCQTYLGPAGAWWMKDQIVDRVPILLGCLPTLAEKCDSHLRLQLVDSNGALKEVLTDHVIAATGYKIDLRRLNFLSEEIRASLRSNEGAPVLSGSFESSIPGLYFVGLASAYDFGPVMRFMFGARYTARRLSGDLCRLG